MASKQIPQTPILPNPQGTESSYDKLLSRQLFQAFVDIAFILNNETAKASAPTVAGQTNLMVFDFDNNLVERVTVGAADSGGAGFKLLRIPN